MAFIIVTAYLLILAGVLLAMSFIGAKRAGVDKDDV